SSFEPGSNRQIVWLMNVQNVKAALFKETSGVPAEAASLHQFAKASAEIGEAFAPPEGKQFQRHVRIDSNRLGNGTGDNACVVPVLTKEADQSPNVVDGSAHHIGGNGVEDGDAQARAHFVFPGVQVVPDAGCRWSMAILIFDR